MFDVCSQLLYLLLVNFGSVSDAELDDLEVSSSYGQVKWTADGFVHVAYVSRNGHAQLLSCMRKRFDGFIDEQI